MIVDSHCHLDYPGLAENEAEVLARARAAGVGCMVHIAAKRSGWLVGLALAERRPEVFCVTCGVTLIERNSLTKSSVS